MSIRLVDIDYTVNLFSSLSLVSQDRSNTVGPYAWGLFVKDGQAVERALNAADGCDQSKEFSIDGDWPNFALHTYSKDEQQEFDHYVEAGRIQAVIQDGRLRCYVLRNDPAVPFLLEHLPKIPVVLTDTDG